MKIATYPQKLLEKCLQSAFNLEPIAFCGMFDSGLSFLFHLSIPLLTAELPKNIKPIFVDLSGATTKKTIQSELAFAFSDAFSIKNLKPDYSCITRTVQDQVKKTKIVLVIYLGQAGAPDENLFLFLNRLRSLLGWNFSYCLFLTTRLLFSHTYDSALIDKVVKRNLIPILLRDQTDSLTVIENYEKRNSQKLSQPSRKKIVELSGGNPGLIKALYYQAKDVLKWSKPDILDERLMFTLRGVAQDLPKKFRTILLNPNRKKADSRDLEQLLRFGYLYQNKKEKAFSLFSPLFKTYLSKFSDAVIIPATTHDQELLYFSKSQRKVLRYLKKSNGKIVSKDTIAEIIWGKNWEDKYSDWAIDQLVHTLRERISSTQYPGKLVTKKGEGIIFVDSV